MTYSKFYDRAYLVAPREIEANENESYEERSFLIHYHYLFSKKKRNGRLFFLYNM